MKSIVTAAVLAAAFAAPASSAVVFSSDFNALTPGLGLTSVPGFNITGNVDVVSAANGFGIVTSSAVIDLDGTAGAGRVATMSNFLFNTGDTLTLTFIAGGAQRGSAMDRLRAGFEVASLPANTSVGFGNVTGTGLYAGLNIPMAFVLSELGFNVNLPGTAPFTTSTLSFTALNSGTLRPFFATNSADNIGPLLQGFTLDITAAAVPEPASWAMLIAGFGLVGATMRRRRMAAI